MFADHYAKGILKLLQEDNYCEESRNSLFINIGFMFIRIFYPDAQPLCVRDSQRL